MSALLAIATSSAYSSARVEGDPPPRVVRTVRHDDGAVFAILDQRVETVLVAWKSARAEGGEFVDVPRRGWSRIVDLGIIPRAELERGVALQLGLAGHIENVPAFLVYDEIPVVPRPPDPRDDGSWTCCADVHDAEPPAPDRDPAHAVIPVALLVGLIVAWAATSLAMTTSSSSLPRARASRRRAAT